MTEFRRSQFQVTIKQQLAKSRAKQVRPAHDFGDLHGVVVDHDSELVSRNVVFPPDDEIAEFSPGDSGLRTGAAVDEVQYFAIRNAKTPVAPAGSVTAGIVRPRGRQVPG